MCIFNFDNVDINKFLKIIIIFCFPFILLLGSYFVFDPFKVLFEYDNYYDNFFVEPNRDFVSVEKYLKYNDTINYKSFIFGSSRLMAWRTDDWENYISDSNAFHFDAYKDNLYGIWCKINLIDRVGEKLENVLLVIEYDLLNDFSNIPDRLFMKHHIYSETTKFSFHNYFFRQFLNSNFYIEYFDFLIFKKKRDYMKQLDFNEKWSDKYSNDFYIKNLDREINNNPEKYYSRQVFYKRDSVQLFYEKCLFDKQIEYLEDIKSIFEKNNTNYKIVISPLYDQKKLQISDFDKLSEIFGKEKIYDFSGINSFTKDINNYYDIYHYRPKVVKEILKLIYK